MNSRKCWPPAEHVLPCKANVLVSLSWIIVSIDLQRRELKYAVLAASLRFRLLHVISCKHGIDMHLHSTLLCLFIPQYLPNAQARFSQSNPTQLFHCTVATATCFVPLSSKLTTACVTWDSYSLFVESSGHLCPDSVDTGQNALEAECLGRSRLSAQPYGEQAFLQ